MLPRPKIAPPLDPDFRPAAVAHPTVGQTCTIAIERPDGSRAQRSICLTGDQDSDNFLAERTAKFLLWQVGGNKVLVGGPTHVFEHLQSAYSAFGARAFDVDLMATVFGGHVSIEHSTTPGLASTGVRSARKPAAPAGLTMPEGYRIGFDLGASDRKVAALANGEIVFSQETVWDPRGNSDPEYHYQQIKAGVEEARRHLPRLDAIGGSSAGVIVNNRVMVSSLFRGVAKGDYPKARDVFIRLQGEYGVPLEVANDGDVTALAGAMSMGEGRILGIAMGSSEAAGYVDAEGRITGWLNELAFAPIDYAPTAPADEWSGDIGCGVQYLTQQAVFRLAPEVGIDLSTTDVLADKLKIAQSALESGHAGARQIWETIGVYFGYAIAHYAAFYDVGHVLVLGRVTSGSGGSVIVETARRVLEAEFPGLAEAIRVSLPDEKSRRVGQAVAAASLPLLSTPRAERN